MAFLYEKPVSSTDSLLSSEGADCEAQLPKPEPLGSSVALAQPPPHRWWWRKKWPLASSVGSRSPPKGPAKALASIVKDKPLPANSSTSSSATSFDAKLGFVLILLMVVAMITLIAVKFKDSEVILAIFSAIALLSLGMVYYVHYCYGSPSRSKVKIGSGEFCQQVSPISPTHANATLSSENQVCCSPASCDNMDASKGKAHRRDWAVTALPNVAWLSHRRPNVTLQQIQKDSQSQSTPQSFGIQSEAKAIEIPQAIPTKLSVEFTAENAIDERLEHLRQALNLVASSTKETMWMHEARLADAITCVLTSCTNEELLFELKQAIDNELRLSKVDDRCANLHAAVFQFLQKGERDAVLTHLSAVHLLQNSDGTNGTTKRQRLLVSDIDDTLVPTFKDRRGFSWGVPYPGVRQLYKELVLGQEESVSVKEDELLRGRVAFVTARPGILRNWTKQEISKAGFDGSLILMGYATTATSPQGMLAQKVKQVRELRSLWPECSIILVGDNGQRDIDLGALLLKEELVEAVFIHDIFLAQNDFTRTVSASLGTEIEEKYFSPRPPVFRHTTASSDSLYIGMKGSYIDEELLEDEEEAAMNLLKIPEDERLASIQPRHMSKLISAPAALGSVDPSFPLDTNGNKRLVVLEPSVPLGFRYDDCSRAGIDLFQTYAGAALKCFQKGLIDVDALERVARACAIDLGATSKDGDVKQRLIDSLLRDVARIALEFHHKSPAEKVEFLEFIHEAIKKKGTSSEQLPPVTA